MNKTDFVAAVAENSGLSKSKAGDAVNAFIDVVTKELSQGGKVQIVGFGTFDTRVSAAHEARNPRTGETVDVPEKITPKFSAGKALKDALK